MSYGRLPARLRAGSSVRNHAESSRARSVLGSATSFTMASRSRRNDFALRSHSAPSSAPPASANSPRATPEKRALDSGRIPGYPTGQCEHAPAVPTRNAARPGVFHRATASESPSARRPSQREPRYPPEASANDLLDLIVQLALLSTAVRLIVAARRALEPIWGNYKSVESAG